MRVLLPAGNSIELGTTETKPTIGIIDYSRRVTDDFGVTTVVERGFARRMSVRLAVSTGEVDALQRRLADLRATAATWIANDRLEWLKVRGFYKDFEVELPTESISYCSLSVEGLAETETVVDYGVDPSPDGQSSTLQLLQPATITDAVLVNSSVPENDASAWSAETAYNTGARVVRGHAVYESLAASTGADPSTDPAKWLNTGPTNRWAMFDQALGTATTTAGSITVTLQAGTVNGVAALDVAGSTIRVQAPGYDRMLPAGPGAVVFAVPQTSGAVTVTVAGPGQVSVGTLLIGRAVQLGITETSPTAGITDFSRKEVDDFGEVAVVQRAWAKRMTARALIRTDALDVVANRIASVRAQPSLWIGSAGLDSMTVYGFFKEFSIEVGESVSKLSLLIEGLSKAAPVVPFAPDGGEVAALTAAVERIASDGWLTRDEKPQAMIARRSLTDQRAALEARAATLGNPADVADEREAATAKMGALNVYLAGLAPPWDDPTRDTPIDPAIYFMRWTEAGEAIARLAAAFTGQPGRNAPLVRTQWSVDGVGGWHDTYADGDLYQRQSSDDGVTWGPPVRVVGEAATSGADGVSPSIIFTRSDAVPGTPGRDTGNPPPGWTDAPSPGSVILWQSLSRFRGAMQLDPWSAPVRITGPSGRDGASAFTLTAYGNAQVFPNRILVAVSDENFQTDGAYSNQRYGGDRAVILSYRAADPAPGGVFGASFVIGLGDVQLSQDLPQSIVAGFWHYYDGAALKVESRLFFGPTRWIGDWSGLSTYSIDYDAKIGVARWLVDGAVVSSENIGMGRRLGLDFKAQRTADVLDISLVAGGSNGADGRDGTDGSNGLDGTNGQSIHIAYADSADGADNFTTGAAGGRTFIGVYTDTNPGADSGDPNRYGWTRLRGIDGTNGLRGPGGYVHLAYSNAADGSVVFHLSDPAGLAWLGTYTDQVEADSTDPARYAWSLIKGEKGDPGSPGAGNQTSGVLIGGGESAGAVIAAGTTGNIAVGPGTLTLAGQLSVRGSGNPPGTGTLSIIATPTNRSAFTIYSRAFDYPAFQESGGGDVSASVPTGVAAGKLEAWTLSAIWQRTSPGGSTAILESLVVPFKVV